MKRFLKVISQTAPVAVRSEKAEGGQVMKSVLVLQEPGGKYENAFACTLLGTLATCKFYAGDIVFASLVFNAREYNGTWYQDVMATDVVKIKS